MYKSKWRGLLSPPRPCALFALVELKLQDRSRLQVPLNSSPSLEMKMVFFDPALSKYSLTQTLTIYMYKSESEEKLLFPSPPHQGALVARVGCQHLFGPVWQDSSASVTYISIFADQGHIILLISPNIIIICVQSSEINVGKLAKPIIMRPNRAKSKFQLITPRGQLGSSWTVQLVPNFPFRSDILHNYHCFHIRPGGLIMKWHW